MTIPTPSGLVPSGVDIEGEREGRHTETVRGERQPIPDYFRNPDGGWTALSWSGFNVLGNSASIDAVKKSVHAQQYVENVRDELVTLRSERDAATSAHDDLVAALRAIITLDVREYEFPADWPEQIAACPECERYKGHPIQHGICDTHRRPLWDREKHDRFEREALAIRMKDIARATLSKTGAS